jgi:hypothetical protein
MIPPGIEQNRGSLLTTRIASSGAAPWNARMSFPCPNRENRAAPLRRPRTRRKGCHLTLIVSERGRRYYVDVEVEPAGMKSGTSHQNYPSAQGMDDHGAVT